MTQNTEQNERTVREQDGQVQEMHADMVKAVCGRRSDYPEDVFRAYLKRHIVQAEARGAEEQRQKDAEDQKPSAWRYVGERGPRATTNFHEATLNALRGVTALYERPANVAALEAEIASLKEAEQLARADAEASKARVKVLEEALGHSCRCMSDSIEGLEAIQAGHIVRIWLRDEFQKVRAALTCEGGV